MNGENKSHECRLFLLRSFMEYQKGYENYREKSYCLIHLPGIHHALAHGAWKIHQVQRSLHNGDRGGLWLLVSIHPLPKKLYQFQEIVYTHIRDINGAFQQASSPRPDVQGLHSEILAAPFLCNIFFSSSAPQDSGVSLIYTLRSFALADPVYQSKSWWPL